ncbi:AAA family ATPase [Sphingopyxis indica]|uniref:Primase C terminal 1 (PriCT-1) n=1 Tax=Sphingopyxis indica TaxID=436663 RepID=A0A239DET2_9SPHN|nr:AAA family ATPase [Sphingopyxis indica]SNS30915.1 Primase C terminal 1 (PriCT-1) [Sphingopyxis indica]
MALSNRIRLTIDRPASMLSMMKWFAKQGVPVFPIHSVADGICSCGDRDCDDQGKHPIGQLAPKGCHSATTDLKVIRKWHRAFPDMNYGVATKGLAVIDCDSREALDDFRRTYKPAPTFTVKTARGFHFYFLGEMPARNGARPNLDVKSGPGCYVVGPGSIHLSGAVYSPWEDEPIAQLSEAIREITAQPKDEAPLASNGPIPVGMRNTTLTKFAGYLRAAGANQRAMLETLKALNRSMTDDPLPDREVRQIARSISKKPGKVWPTLVPFSEIPDENLEWLWYPYVCRGTLGLLDGDPGDGKSQLCAWLCARITRGDALPGGDRSKPANVILFNFEDLKGAVIKPRLIANGADLDRVFIQSRQFQLTEEMVAWLDGEIADKRPAVVILDPIQAFMSGVDGNSNIDVREFMSPLAEIAAKYLCAIICVRHFGKSEQDKACQEKS